MKNIFFLNCGQGKYLLYIHDQRDLLVITARKYFALIVELQFWFHSFREY